MSDIHTINLLIGIILVLSGVIMISGENRGW
jgi:hypothetical protein